jgi:ketosteroid isomerase-like protein
VDAAEIVRELFGAANRRDADAVLAVTHPDAEFWLSGTAEQTGRQEPYRGHAGVLEYFADVDAVWEEFALSPGDLRIAGDGVVSFGSVRVRAVGEAQPRDVSVIWVFKLRAGTVLTARVVQTAAEANRMLAS